MPVAESENTELSDRPLEQIQDEIATLASHIYAGTCRWLELVGELDRRGGWAEFGCGSCAEWLAWRCALTPRSAREHVRVARRLLELPLIQAAFARGELSYAKVRALTRVADAENEGELLELGRHLTASQLERAVRAFRRVTREEASDLQVRAYVGYGWEPDGSLVVRACLAPEDGALFLRALDVSRDRLRERERSAERGSAEPQPGSRPSNAEALVALAETALTSETEGRSGGERYQVVVHVDTAGLTADDGACTLEDGPALAGETARRLACDASVVQIVEHDGEPLSVGRRTRTVPSSVRRALKTRDQGCRFPGCENRRFLDAHHIQHWARGGETRLDNLVFLCGRHHRLVHEGGYTVEQLADGSVGFRDPWGAPVAPVPRPPQGDADRLLPEPGPRDRSQHVRQRRRRPDGPRARCGRSVVTFAFVVPLSEASLNAMLRELRESDAQEVAALFQTVYGDERPIDAEEIVSWVNNAELRPEWLQVLELDGRVVGYGDIMVEDDEVALDAAAPGHWDTFFAWAEEQARAADARRVRLYFPAGHHTEDLARDRGYQLWRSSYTMNIVLDDAPPDRPPPPNGITFRSYRPEDEEPLRVAVNEAFAKDPFFHEESPQRFREFNLRARGFDPSLWLLAWDGQELAGFALAFLERVGEPDLGWIGQLGVREPWRRRGLGDALLRTAIGELHARGLRRVGLGVDTENETGALRLYERAGMEAVRQGNNWVLDL